ncbi:aspartate 4-decarboxylase [Alkalibacterium subtropicum]|uniref:Aminotransferase n=1 Tax=Alkalibacterium subtropicum TaxID=753702 RepID=A0A1I1FA19_9LACT|nr:aspartate 4-decarboxylase [Alkalibacterium subtropicum]
MKADIESLNPFELNVYLEKLVGDGENETQEWLNAGRGNPNWTAAVPREAYYILGEFATTETLDHEDDIIGSKIKEKKGRVDRFQSLLEQKKSKGADFLKDVWANGEHLLGMKKEKWLTYILDYMMGDNYPYPVRVLTACEQPIQHYMHHELFGARPVPFDVFAVEGGTAGIVYLFESLVNNHLLEPEDKIALMIPTFAPYLEIPELPEYGFETEYIKAELMEIEGQASYQFSKEEIDRLRNTDIKAVFVVNPSNPTANAIYDETIEQLKGIVKTDNPDLMILSDDVYGTFLDEFTSLFTSLPFNTACIYSYSKYFGATGWRVGALALSEDNVFDKRLRELPEGKKEELDKRYGPISSSPRDLLFIDRLVADSRSVALNHVAGLSAPQQVMMALFSLYSLLDKEDSYKKKVMEMCYDRQKLLFKSLDLQLPLKALDTAYYSEIDFALWLEDKYGDSFKDFIVKHHTMTDLIAKLVQEERLMLLKAEAFGSSAWSVRVSLANLETAAYSEVGKRIVNMMDRMHKDWKNNRGDGE